MGYRLSWLHHRWFLWRNYYTARRRWLTVILMVAALSSLAENAVFWWQDAHPQCTSVAIRSPGGAILNGQFYAARGGTVTVRFCGQNLTETPPGGAG